MSQKTTEKQVIERLRQICAVLPESREIVTHGHPAFSNNKGIFLVLENYRGDLSLCVNVGLEAQGIFLKDKRFYRTPYIGHRGWVSLRLRAAAINWEEIDELVRGSHQLVLQRNRSKTAAGRSL